MTVCRSSLPLLDPEEVRRIQDLFLEKRIPAAGSLELTRRCNLRCRHCYAGPAAAGAQPELTSRQWFDILEQAAAAGCLTLLITGGEPLLRPDFPDVYQRAKSLGILVTVFTNGTLVTPDIVRLFQEWPPEEVEITILGSTAATHDALTGGPGSFQRFRDGVAALLAAGIRTALKAVVMRPNRTELGAMERLARDLGVPFRIDTILFPRLDGDRSPLELRLPPAEAAAADLGDPERAQRWQAAMEELSHIQRPDSDELHLCGAGQNSFHIDPGGVMTPCLMLCRPSCDLTQGTFVQGWAALAALSGLRAPDDYPCRHCNVAPLCGVCPAHSLLENGLMDRPADFCCQLSQERCTILRIQAATREGIA